MEVKAIGQAAELDPQQVQQELEKANQLLSHYPDEVADITLVQANDKAVVWKVETAEGPKALKWMKVRGGKAVYSILSHHYLELKGFPVPKISKTKEENLCLGQGNRLGFLAQWVEGRPVDRNIDEEWRLFVHTLADFHRTSEGMAAINNVRTKTKLGGWPLEYRKKIGRMKQWLKSADGQSHSFFTAYKELAPEVIAHAENLLDRLEQSVYWDWSEKAQTRRGLCHGDYGESNTVLTPEGQLYVIDMDTITHDLPVRDLRKVFESYLDPNIDLTQALHWVLDPYVERNPLTPEQIEVFRIDVQFPHKTYQVAKAAASGLEMDAAGLRETAQLDLARAAAVAQY